MIGKFLAKNGHAQIIKHWKYYLKKKVGIYKQRSYSQCGEDLIIRFVFNALGIAKPTYLDIGAYHPYDINNTYLFYRQGAKGVNIEPNSQFAAKFKRARRRDITLNVGIGTEDGHMDFFIMSCPTLNTFSESEARQYEKEQGIRIKKVVPVKVLSFDTVVNNYMKKTPDFVSLDVEGMDMEILKSIDFSVCRPTVFCIETITYSNERKGVKNSEINNLMIDLGYMLYADTYINSIYVDKKQW